MELQVKVWILLKVIEKCVNAATKQYLESVVRYENDEKKVTINSLDLTSADLTLLADLCEKHYVDNVPDKDDRPVHNKFYPFMNLARKVRSALSFEQLEDDIYVKTLPLIPLAMKAFFKKDPYKVVFKKNYDGWMLPYVVTNIDYSAPRQSAPTATIRFTHMYRGKSQTMSVSWYSARKTCEGLLKEHGFVLATEELLKGYYKRIERYNDFRCKLGLQVNVSNMAKASSWVPMTVDGKPTKCVIDDTSDSQESGTIKDVNPPHVNLPFWDDQDIRPLDVFSYIVEKELDTDEENEDDPKQYTVAPIHPYVKCFDLNKHRFLETHVANIDDYEWDHNLADKLILDQETKDLIEILVDSTKIRSEDIIAGKMSGTIVLATGVPGVGKTLTAEVFSEKIEKSLYVVQCSQLGIKVESIETNLNQVLSRAARWGSILLIDEADVYIRDRGTDIVHNAIVGVFLRLIEYYNGVLFMTSNRGDIIDDAIISRATAWIKYELPNEDLLFDIWKVLSTQFKVDLGDREIRDLIRRLPLISGRTVRNLLKLVTTLDYEKVKDQKQQRLNNFNHIIKASKFQKLEQ